MTQRRATWVIMSEQPESFHFYISWTSLSLLKHHECPCGPVPSREHSAKSKDIVIFWRSVMIPISNPSFLWLLFRGSPPRKTCNLSGAGADRVKSSNGFFELPFEQKSFHSHGDCVINLSSSYNFALNCPKRNPCLKFCITHCLSVTLISIKLAIGDLYHPKLVLTWCYCLSPNLISYFNGWSSQAHSTYPLIGDSSWVMLLLLDA